MRALTFNGSTLSLERNYPIPTPTHGEALVHVSLIGICNTDIEIVCGYMDFKGVLGHEFVGTVEEIYEGGDKERYAHLLGQRVVGEINASCHKDSCPYCQRNMPTHCPERTTLGILNRGGAFAEYLRLPLENLHPVPANVSDEEAVFTEPLAANFEMLEQLHIKPTDRVVILGDGKMGQLAALVLTLTSCELTMLGKHEEKLSLANNLGIATQTVQNLPSDAFDPAHRADIVVECTGSASGLELATRLVRPRGTIILKSTVADNSNLHLAPFVIDEIRVQGSRCGPFPPALRALAHKRIDPKPLISARFSLDEALPAFDRATQSGVLKVLVKI